MNKRAAARVEDGTMYTVKRKGEKSRVRAIPRQHGVGESAYGVASESSEFRGFWPTLEAVESCAQRCSRELPRITFYVTGGPPHGRRTVVSRFRNGERVAS